jgi:archaellum component FlaC
LFNFLAMKAPIDSIEDVLDRLSDMREELLSLERAIERIEAKRCEVSGEPDPVSAISVKIAL